MATNPISSGTSGLDTMAIVNQLMEIERQPLLKLKQKQADFQAKISAYGALLSSAKSLRDAVTALKGSDLFGRSVSLSDSTYFTATATSTANLGTYNVKVKQIASAQSMHSIRFGSQSGKVADLSSYGTQRIKIQVGTGAEKEILINGDNNTLSGIKDAINNAGAGVTASVVKESDKFVINASNKAIVFNDGGLDKTATIEEGTWTGAELATKIKAALDSASGGTNTFTVDYNTTATNKFTITNSTGAATVNIKWSDANTTSEQILGFSPVDRSIASGISLSGDDAVDGTYNLTLTSSSTGAANTIKLLVDEDLDGTYEEAAGGERDTVGLSSLATNATFDSSHVVTSGYSNMTETQSAIDAILSVNNLEVTKSNNTITDVIDGVTLTLIKGDANYGGANAANIVLTVSKDQSSLKNKLNSFVSSYNKAMATVKDLRGNAAQRGILMGDALVSTLQNTMRTVTTTLYNNTTLSSFGLTHDKDGVLALDTTALDSAMTSNETNVVTTVNQMAVAFESALNVYINTGIPARTSGYQDSIKNVQRSEENLTRRLQTVESALRKKYINLDRVLNQLNGVSNSLAQQLSQINKAFGGK
ncbi:MAG: flagellar filament capping protein FliD [Nitrospirota bacterium]